MATPLLNPLRVNGGTFYSFTSGNNDLTRTITDDDIEFSFSKFVLLDIPDVATPTANLENYLVWEGLGSNLGGGTSSVPSVSTDHNYNLAESFQNYALNLEQLILSGNNNLGRAYDNNTLSSTAERVFWKWLRELNVLRHREATSAESNEDSRYVEVDDNSYYNKVVKYIGDVDVVNTVRRDGNAYAECYIHVPTSHGNTPVVLFKTLSDNNYSPGTIWSNGNVYIDGRDSASVHPAGLNLQAFYDDDSTDQYVAENVFGDVTLTGGTAMIGSPKPVLFSKMDGMVLDFDPASYQGISNNPNISLINEFNSSSAASNFKFNMCLVYYDVYRKSDFDERATNLFGVLVLDDYINQGSGNATLKSFEKFKPNPVTKLNGNSYGLKLNLKYDSSIDNVGVETIVNEYSTFSMDLFIDASTRMQEAADLFIAQKQEVIDIKEKINEIEQFFYSQEDLRTIQTKLSELESMFNNSKASFDNQNSLLDLINKLSDRINLLATGQLTSDLTFNTDAFFNGEGTRVDKSTPGKVKFNNIVQKYNNFSVCLNDSSYLESTNGNGANFDDTSDGNTLVLGPYGNYFKQINQNSDPQSGIETLEGNLIINISDKDQKWKNGQTFTIVFSEKIELVGNHIIFKTDYHGIVGNSMEKTIATIGDTDLISLTPIIELICKDYTNFTFDVNVIR